MASAPRVEQALRAVRLRTRSPQPSVEVLDCGGARGMPGRGAGAWGLGLLWGRGGWSTAGPLRRRRHLGRAVPHLSAYGALVHRRAGTADSLEEHLVSGDLDQHEGSIGVEGSLDQLARFGVAGAKLGGTSRGEILNPLLGAEPLVDVLMSLKHHVYSVLEEDRLQHRAELDLGSPAGGGIEWMVEVGNLPVRTRRGQLLLQPGDLLRIQVVAVQHEEAGISLLEGAVALSAQVERLVEFLVGIIVVAQRGVELNSGVEQGLVGPLEFLGEILGTLRAVDVVAQQDRKGEREALVISDHLGPDLVLGLVAEIGRAHV